MDKTEQLKNECHTIEDNARHTADAHYYTASWNKKLAFCFEVVPAVIAALSSLLIVGEIIPAWWGWLTVVSAVTTAVGVVLSPHKTYYEELKAGKNFTTIKNQAKTLCNTYAHHYTIEQFFDAVKTLNDKYDQLVQISPPTEEWAYTKAQEKNNTREQNGEPSTH